MLSEGAEVPGFELPALVDGEKRRVALDAYLGDDVVIIVFYPADFNPACDEESCDLDELDLFTMQKDVTILGISPDSVYSHRAFAAKYDLKVPLLSDTDGEVAQRYDIEFVDDIGQSLVERAVAVVDHDGTVTYSWSTDDMTELPRVEEIKNALAETGGDDTAFARYRVGHAHYTEGRRAFTSAMESVQNTEWVMAQHDFQQAREEFEAAADRFDTAVRFVDDESLVPIYEGANEKATALWQAADWLTRSASAYASGSGSEGQELRDDAEIPMSTVREYREPPDPDDEWPPDVGDLEKAATDDDDSILPTESDVDDAALAVDIDEETPDDEATTAPDTAEPEDVEATASSDDTATASGADSEDDIDDDELAEIQAELAANNPESEPSVDELSEESTAIVEAPPMAEAEETMDDEAVTVDGDTDQSAATVEESAIEAGGATVADTPTDEAAGDAADETAQETAAASNEVDDTNTSRGETQEEETDDSGPELQLELAEPEPDPIDADGPPVSRTDEESDSNE